MKRLIFLKGCIAALSMLRIHSPARILTRGLVFLLLVGLSSPAFSQSFNSLKVLQSGIDSNSSCLQLETRGVCIHFYIKCSLFGCSVKTKTVTLIEHNLPELVVTAFREPGETPYFEIRNTYATPAKRAVNLLMGESASGGYSPMTTSQTMTYNESNIVGNPMANQVKAAMLASGRSYHGFLCESKAVPLKPYFMSEYDAIAWRHAELNIRRESLVPGLREIGTNLLKTWGSVHPRIGFVMQNQPPKAAAVVSQRGIDIISKNNQRPHVYSPYLIDDAKPENRVAWQMIEPTASRGCEKFGAEGEWSEGKQAKDDDGDFAWNYWAPVDCCGPKPRFTFFTQKIRF